SLEVTEFDLRDLVEQVGELFAVQAAKKNIEFVCAVEPGTRPTRVAGDPTRVRQLLVNIVGNAIKFTNEGEVCLRAWIERTDEREILVSFEVRDTGIGIPPEK